MIYVWCNEEDLKEKMQFVLNKENMEWLLTKINAYLIVKYIKPWVLNFKRRIFARPNCDTENINGGCSYQ